MDKRFNLYLPKSCSGVLHRTGLVENPGENFGYPVIPVAYSINFLKDSFQKQKWLEALRRMVDLLSDAYPWVKALHVMSVIAWMAGLFYLPRLFVYHVERASTGNEIDLVFQTMEWKLYRYIMVPSMVASWLFGLALVLTPGIVDWSFAWPWCKAGAVLMMTWFHVWLSKRRSEFAGGSNRLTGRQYRLMNEVPTVLMSVIVISVIVKF